MPIIHHLSLLPLLTFLSGCALIGGAIRESKTDSVLSGYMKEIRYDLPRKEVVKKVVAQIQENANWHQKHDSLFQVGQALGGRQEVTISADKCGRREIAEMFKGSATRLEADSVDDFTVKDDKVVLRDPCLKSKMPIEISGIREKYLVHADPHTENKTFVSVLNSADGVRLYHKEFELLAGIDPEKAKMLRAHVEAEHPGLEFEPWK